MFKVTDRLKKVISCASRPMLPASFIETGQGFRVWSLGFRVGQVSGAGFRVQGLSFRVSGLRAV